MVGIDMDSAVSPPAGFQLEVTVFHWGRKEAAQGVWRETPMLTYYSY